ncbi:LuxR C-terminal-related transcriptional regulator [Gordonia sputi]|uniref:helix-turn-helix transcriptional regulator n=1 Tax=Gordonia sputi TaxID=36823 RepID=UPI002043FD4E|nr:LuxR C-terminal-related transcriptional regulator [Gordonia sputi]MCM3895661.1 LuxR C-terminal-related transcriptional regulator [Gordonia sputi]
MIIEATCVGRDREIAAILDRAAASADSVDGRRRVIVLGAAGMGKSTVLRETLRCAAEQGLSLRIVDDADLLSGDELATAMSGDTDGFVALAATNRTPAIDALLADTLQLNGIDRDAVDILASARWLAIHPTVVDSLLAHTAGNPRAILALFDELPSAAWTQADVALPAPRNVRDDVARILAEEHDDTRRLIEAVCILDDSEPMGTALELADCADPLSAIDNALNSGLLVAPFALTPSTTRPRPADPMTRAAVIELMGLRGVADMHRRAAELTSDSAQQLGHRIAATPAADAALADDVAAMAESLGADGAWAQAAELFRHAGRLTSDPILRDERITLSVDALLAAGDCIAAGSLVPSVEILRETPLRDATLAYLAILRGRSTEAQVRLERAWSIVNLEREPEVAAVIAQRWVLHDLVRCRGTELVEWSDRAISMAGDTSPAGIEAASIRGLGLAWSGRPDLALASYESLSAHVRFGAQAQRVTMGHGWLRLGLGDVVTARSLLESAVSMAALGGSTRISLWSLGWLARVHFSTGDWDSALRVVEEGRGLSRRSGIHLVTGLLTWTAAQIHSLRGDWRSADADLNEATALAGDYEIIRVPQMLTRAHLAEAKADYAGVIRALEPLRQLAAHTPALVEPGWWPWVDVLANALVLSGRHDAADDLLTPHETLAAQRGHHPAQARLGYARGRYLGAIGDIHGARAAFEEALRLVEGLPLRYDSARINFAYGQTLRRSGKRREADTVMGTAREIFASLGAVTYVERCDRELKAGGLHTSRTDSSDVVLTPQEESVAALVARGLSNREVAAELYISPKTVQYHLTRTYAKLGIRSRAELAALRR